MYIKHPKLERPNIESFAGFDIAFVGAKCGIINKTIQGVQQLLNSRYRVLTIDADHNNSVAGVESRADERIMSLPPHTNESWFEDKLQAQYFDLALINGNHYPAAHQIVFLSSEKEDSLKRRKDQLTDVILYVSVDVKGFDWLDISSDIPVVEVDDIMVISENIETIIKSNMPILRGLVLAGGASVRMGTDKSQIAYFDKTQEQHTLEMLSSCGLDSFLSKKDFHSEIPNVIKDSFLGLGPYGAVLSAFQLHRNTAWLVLACDLPYLNKEAIQLLIKNRNPSKFMTALKAKNKDFAEPLVAIYEPRSYPRMLHALGAGYNCPTKLLRNTDIQVVEVPGEWVENVNTIEEREAAMRKLKSDSVKDAR